MADRYWVGGTGTWGSSQTTNWSAATGLSFTASCTGTTLTTVGSPALVVGMTVFSSTHVSLGTIVSGSVNTWVVTVGGTFTSQSMSAATVGASVPTAADNVFFDANSNSGTTAFTVTMANTPRVCNDFTASGLDGTMTLAGAGIGLTVSGSLFWPTTNFTRTYTGGNTFNATTTGKTVTTNGASVGSVTFNGVGGAWTLGSALNASSTITVTNGTFDTSSSGNYAITAGDIFSSNSNIRTINLNASTVNLSLAGGVSFSTQTNLTFNAGTSQINCASSNSALSAETSITFYNVAFTSASLASPSINGTFTFNNLSFAGRITVGIGVLTISADQTINGTLTVSAGTAAANRLFIASNTIGTPRTLTCASIAAMSDVDFRDITIAGAHGTLSGTRLGDCKGNTNITFGAGKTVFYRQTGSANWGAASSGSWSATSGGALDATQFPLAQDTAVFPAATYPASGSTTTIQANYNIGTIDMSLRTSNTMTLATATNSPLIYGNWINGTGTTISGTQPITFAGRTTQTIRSEAKSFTQPITINSPSGSVTLQDALTTGSTRTVTLTNGTLDLQSSTLTTGLFSSNNSNIRTLAFGTGKIDVTGTGTAWDALTATNFSTSGSKTVDFTSVGSTTITCNSGLSEANAVDFNVTGGTYQFRFGYTSGISSVRNLNFTGYAGTWTGLLGDAYIYGNLIMSATMLVGNSGSKFFAATSGTKTITSNGVSLNLVEFAGVGGTWQLQDAMTVTQSTGTKFVNGTLDLNGKTLTTSIAQTLTGTKNITFNGGTIAITTASGIAWYNNSPTNFTTTAGTGVGTISMTAATAKSFVGGGSTYNCTINQGGAGDLSITGSNTFSNITNTYKSTGATSILFTAATTSTFTDWNASGESTRLLTIGSVTAASHTLSKASGTVSSDFLSISRSSATGGAGWYAGANSTDGGNNSGWIFTAPPAPSAGNGNFLMFF